MSSPVLEREKKMKVHAREGVRPPWRVDPLRQALEVYALDGGRWKTLGTHAGQAHVHAEPSRRPEGPRYWAGARCGNVPAGGC